MSLSHPSEQIHGNPPLPAVVFLEDHVRIPGLKNLAGAYRSPDPNNPDAGRIHEDDIAPPNGFHVARMREMLPCSRVASHPHQFFPFVPAMRSIRVAQEIAQGG